MSGHRLEIYRDKAGEWRWHVSAANGRIVADSGEGYTNRADAEDIARDLFPDLVDTELPDPATTPAGDE